MPAKYPTEARSQRPGLWILVTAGAVYLIAVALVVPFVPDDSYISYRYAENLADGNGLTFNTRDAPVEGYSNFLWVIACAILRGVGFSLPVAGSVLSGLVGLGTIALLWGACRKRRAGHGAALTTLLLMATSAPFVVYAVSGLETALFAFLLVVALVAYRRVCDEGGVGAHLALALAGCALTLCRPEGVLIYPVLFGLGQYERLRAQRSRGWSRSAIIGLGLFIGVMGIYTTWRVAYFGGWLPTSFHAKGGGDSAFALGWLRNLHTYFVSQGYDFPPHPNYYVAVAVGAVAGWRKEPDPMGKAALVVALVLALVYLSFVDWMPGMRYHAPLLPLLFVPLAGCFRSVPETSEGTPRTRGQTAWSRALRPLGVGGIVTILVSFAMLMVIRLPVRAIETANREGLIPLGRWLEAHMPPGSTLAISDVGAVPYYSGFYTIDIHPESLIDRTVSREGLSPAYFFSKNPTVVVVVSRGVFVPRMFPPHYALLSTDEFAARYRFLGTVRSFWIEDRSYWVYVPKDFPPLDDAAFDSFPGGIGAMRRLEG